MFERLVFSLSKLCNNNNNINNLNPCNITIFENERAHFCISVSTAYFVFSQYNYINRVYKNSPANIIRNIALCHVLIFMAMYVSYFDVYIFQYRIAYGPRSSSHKRSFGLIGERMKRVTRLQSSLVSFVRVLVRS